MSDGRTVGDIGEFGLIHRIAQLTGETGAVIGIGDDTAVLNVGGPEYLLATVDMQVEGVHFVRDLLSPSQIGHKAVAVNISDIAAMGGAPRYALVSLALSSDVPVSFLDGLYGGMTDECRTFNAFIVGGNITRSRGPLAIDVVLLGTVPVERLVNRSGAAAGNALCVTGYLGSAAAARLACEAGIERWDDDLARWIEGHLVPRPRVAAGQGLAATAVRAMIDISDGLSGDAGHLCAASDVGAIIRAESLPLEPQMIHIAAQLGHDPVDLALHGGEDYELLVALPEETFPEAQAACAPLPLTLIGSILPAEMGVTLQRAGAARPLTSEAWRHF